MGDDWAGKFDEFRRHLRGRLPLPHAGDLHHGAHREDLRHDVTSTGGAAHAPRLPLETDATPCPSPHVVPPPSSPSGCSPAPSRSPRWPRSRPRPPPTGPSAPAWPSSPPTRRTTLALDRAEKVLADGEEAGSDGSGEGSGVDASMALRDLFLARPALEGDDALRAESLLARPTDPGDPFGNSYAVPSSRRCGVHVCVHFVERTADAPPSLGWVDTNVQVMENVWRHHVGRLGYRAPRNDGDRGGDGRFDVYLKEIGEPGPLRLLRARAPGRRRAAPGGGVLRARRRLRCQPVRPGAAQDACGSPPPTSSSTPSSTPTTSRRTSGCWSRPPPGWRRSTPTTSTTTAPTCRTVR